MPSSAIPLSGSGPGFLAHESSAWQVKGSGRASGLSASFASEETMEGCFPVPVAGPFCGLSLRPPGPSGTPFRNGLENAVRGLDARGAAEAAEESVEVEHQGPGLTEC